MAKKKTSSNGSSVSQPPPRPRKKAVGKTLPPLVAPLAANLGSRSESVESEADREAVDALLDVNSSFYRALTSGDIDAMAALWDQQSSCLCVHPSGVVLRDWPDIEDSWRQIIEGNPPKVIPESETVSLQGETGIVFCVERIISSAGMGLAGSTNVFRNTGKDGWKLFWHHSALLPVGT